MPRPRLLDLFCGQGGAAMGYHRAGFDVVGVDIRRQPRYPFEFHQGDALEFLAANAGRFHVVHASPPCQAYSITRYSHDHQHPDLIAELRDLLMRRRLPYVIENVAGAPLHHPLQLCGTEFDITAVDDDGTLVRLERHRLFESSIFLVGNGGCRHDTRVKVAGVYSSGGRADRDAPEVRGAGIRHGGYTPTTAVRARLLGCEWMSQRGLSQAIPPAYTEFIGGQILDVVAEREPVGSLRCN